MSGHPEVGVAGLGVMGSAIARRLLRRERTVRVYDVRQDAMAELVRDGAAPADSAAQLASSSVVILSSTPPTSSSRWSSAPTGS